MLNRKHKVYVFILAIAATSFVLVKWSYTGYNKRIRLVVKGDTTILYPYRTTYTTDSGQGLTAYILREGESIRDICYEKLAFDAVVKQIDPAKEDYKAHCRAIVSDIIKTMATNKIEVSIYDNDKNDADGNLDESNIVAVYYGDAGGEGDSRIVYYPNTNNKYAGTECFYPRLKDDRIKYF